MIGHNEIVALARLFYESKHSPWRLAGAPPVPADLTPADHLRVVQLLQYAHNLSNLRELSFTLAEIMDTESGAGWGNLFKPSQLEGVREWVKMLVKPIAATVAIFKQTKVNEVRGSDQQLDVC